jgi:hypothetical protein
MSLAVQARFGRIPARLAARMRKTLGSALGKRWCALGVLAAVLAAPAARARADERVFTYSYEPKVLPKDALEFEQWATLRAGKEDGVFSRWDLRTEFEYGLLDQLTTALYLNFESLHIDRDEEQVDEFEFKGLSSEWKWKFLDPTADPIGVLGYFEATTNFEDVELEEKLVLGKNFDRVVLAFNAICEQEWEFENEETETELAVEFTAGVAYRFTDRFAVGVEAREVNVFPTWKTWSTPPSSSVRRSTTTRTDGGPRSLSSRRSRGYAATQRTGSTSMSSNAWKCGSFSGSISDVALRSAPLARIRLAFAALAVALAP